MSRGEATAVVERRRLRVTGTVQGVGFRPFVYRLASELELTGSVANDGEGVDIEVEGLAPHLEAFTTRLSDEAPPLAQLAGIQADRIRPVGSTSFTIAASSRGGPSRTPVPPDAGPCAACLRELADPTDRRHRYPLINCTHCGPRYTITERVPYDRATTTMAAFTMCRRCAAEYADPRDRRFHAEPTACPDCGPTLRLSRSNEPTIEGDDALASAVALLSDGRTVAVKGVGGFNLAVDATNDIAVRRLRRAKHRDDKPFAVLVEDLAAAERLCLLDAASVAAVRSPARPIVLAPRRGGAGVAEGVAPGLDDLGILLPPSPLHHLLAAGVGRPLVLTSGNVAHEPMAYLDHESSAFLDGLAVAVLGHDRVIHVRCDDSVLRADVDGLPQPVRRARGSAPTPIPLPDGSARHVLAVGGQLKNTVAVARDGIAFVSHHVGDLDHPAADAAFRQAIAHLSHLHGVCPEVVAHDLHPEYRSTTFAHALDLPTVAVQHHHAHVASCLAEHRRTDQVLGVAFDGLGYGDDGTLWGGEFLVADLTSYERAGSLVGVPQPGGDAAAREPWRMALSWVRHALGEERAAAEGARLDTRATRLLPLLDAASTPRTSSVGRLFDAVAALLGLTTTVTYEGQAAIALEAFASPVPTSAAPVYPCPTATVGPHLVLDAGPLVAAVLRDRDAGVAAPIVAAGFHHGLAVGAARLATKIASARSLSTVALSGGVFQNRRLTGLVAEQLRAADLEVLVHRVVPPNDGGISLGQVAVARARVGDGTGR